MNFCSDNVTGAAPEILAALTANNSGAFASYGADKLTERVESKLKEIFETDLAALSGRHRHGRQRAVAFPALAGMGRHLLPPGCPCRGR